MLLRKMELSGGEFQDEESGRRSGELTFTMEFVATGEHEIPTMMREFNDGRPTLAFWEGIEYGHVRDDAPGSPSASPIAVSLKQAGSPASRITHAMQPGARHMIAIPVTVIGPGGEGLGGMVQIEVDARPC